MNKEMTDLDHRIKELVLTDYSLFVKLVGERHILAIKSCLLRLDEKSIGQVSINLKLSYKQARNSCERCPAPEEMASVKKVKRKN